eukprot:maker-scaffold179_size282488-snap-gene-1.23 protein:Tk10711 transcript:maker-scaffold179_size282488-snap-gene-1.23-mRNA-1 annotation:"low quality protein: traf3-interacting protein 1-like"
MSVPPKVIKKTRDSLGKFVTKPPLNEKLLGRPPFRFLHDVISALIKEHGVFQGLLDNKEMVSDNVKDRDGKIKYLEKVIFATVFATGDNLTAKASKIVSGQEAEKTNEWLQAMAKILEGQIDTSEAVKRVKKGEKPGKGAAAKKGGTGKENSVPQSRRGSKDGSTLKKRQPSRESTAKSTKGPGSARAPIETINEAGLLDDQEASLEPLNEEEPPFKADEPELQADEGGEEVQDGPPMANGLDEEELNGDEVEPPMAEEMVMPDPQDPSLDDRLPTPIPPLDRQAEEEEKEEEPAPQPQTEDRPRTTRRSSARPRTAGRHMQALDEPPPETEAPPNDSHTGSFPLPTGQGPMPRPGSAMTSARPRTGFKSHSEILWNLVKFHKSLDRFFVLCDLQTEALEAGGQQHGALVQQILETQKELNEQPKVEKKGFEIERDSGLTDIGRRRDRESTQREVDKLRASIQTLTRSANPLGKLMDFLQEDVDAMQRELETWRNENRQLKQDLRHEQSLTDKSIEPLKVHLDELDTAVKEQLDKISVIKSNILRNDERISKMIATVGSSGGGGGR